MSTSGPIILTPPPPPPPPQRILGIFTATKDARYWRRKWSTWLAAAAIALDGAAAYFIAAPDEWRAALPASAGMVLLAAGMVLKALIPLATSIQQKAPQP